MQESLCEHLCAEIRIRTRGDRLAINTPFYFPDGDPYVLYLEELSGGGVRLTDLGHTMMHLSYENDVDAFRSGNRAKLFASTLANGGVSEADGELYIDTIPKNLSSAIFSLGQAITSVSDLTFLNRTRVESTFYEDLEAALGRLRVDGELRRNYEVPGLANADKYPVDFMLPGKANDLFIFGVPTRDKARLTTIVLGHLLRAEIAFESLLVFADQSNIPRSDLSRLSNVGGEMVSSLDAQEDLARKVMKRAA